MMYQQNYPQMASNNYSPYQSQWNNQYQQQQIMYQQQTSLPGRIVDDIANVNANEVPMDGSKAYFVKNDESTIYVKQWQSDGTISTKQYSLILDNKEKDSNNLSSDTEKTQIALSDEFLTALDERFSKIEKLLKQKTTSRSRKEVLEND